MGNIFSKKKAHLVNSFNCFDAVFLNAINIFAQLQWFAKHIKSFALYQTFATNKRKYMLSFFCLFTEFTTWGGDLS